MDFILREHGQLLRLIGLYDAVQATHVGFRQSPQDFFGLLEMYNSETWTFFTPAGELGLPYHEMHYISGLPYSEYPYEECFYMSSEIEKKANAKSFSIYWELHCHFYICMDQEGRRKGGFSFTKWANYLISLDMGNSKRRKENSLDKVDERFQKLERARTYITTQPEGGFDAKITFQIYHYQAVTPMSKEALLAGFLMIWLKKCVVPSHPHEVVLPSVALPAVQLVGHRPIAFLLAMMGNIHYGLNLLVMEFLKRASNPRVELPYSYLMAWLVLHYPYLMDSQSIIWAIYDEAGGDRLVI